MRCESKSSRKKSQRGDEQNEKQFLRRQKQKLDRIKHNNNAAVSQTTNQIF
jgi:hypothetical protein